MFEKRESLAELARLSSDLGDEAAAAEALALAEQFARSELNILVVGQFKRGKSSLVNALLSEDLMPTGALPLTGVSTAVRYGTKPSISVQLQDGTRRSATQEELAFYVSEARNPANTLGVSRVDIVRPAEALQGIALFDTPGVGSTFRHNTEAARAILPRTDAAILVVGPEPPIGAEELAYAAEVAAAAVRLFVVFNKADLAAASLDELLSFTRNAIEAVAGSVSMYALSATHARNAQREGRRDPAFDTFVGALRSFVAEHGTEALRTSAQRRVHALLDRSVTLLQMRAEAVALPRAERQERRRALEAALEGLDDRLRFLELTVDDDVRRLRLRLEEELNARHDRELSEFISEAHELARETSRSRRTQLLEAFLRQRAIAWQRDAVALAERELVDYARRYVRTLGEIEEAVIRAGCNALRVEMAALQPRDIAFEPARLTFAVSVDPTTGLEVLTNLVVDVLPGQVRRRMVLAQTRRILESEIDALRGKLRYGIAHDLEPWRRSVRHTIKSSLDVTRSAVLAAFPSGAGNDDEDLARESVRRLRKRLARLWDSFVQGAA